MMLSSKVHAVGFEMSPQPSPQHARLVRGACRRATPPNACLAGRDSRSMGGRITSMNSGPISFQAKRQSIVSVSTTAAELQQITDTALDVVGLRNLLKEIGLSQNNPTIVYCDNQPAIRICHNAGSLSNKTKYLDIKIFKIRELIANKEVMVSYIKSQRNVSDIFTKALPPQQFVYLRDQLTGYSVVQADFV